MNIIGMDGMTRQDIDLEISRGGKFVMYQYCISALIITFKRRSDIYFVRADENAVVKGMGYTTLSLLLGWWGIGHEEPWLILSDLLPQQGDASWYGMRSWIEQGFKDSKRGGWQWQHTRMEDPERAERLWLAVAVTTLWLLRVGGSAKPCETAPAEPMPSELGQQHCHHVSHKAVCSPEVRGPS